MIRSIALAVALVFSLSSCFEYEDVEFVKINDMQIENINFAGATLVFDLTINNPNGYGIKIHPSKVDIKLNDENTGQAALLEKVKLKRKREGEYIARVELSGANGLFQRAMKLKDEKEVSVTLSGKVKGSVLGIPKTEDISITKTIDVQKIRESMKN